MAAVGVRARQRVKPARSRSVDEDARSELMASSSSPSERKRQADEHSAQNVTDSLLVLRQELYNQVQRSGDITSTLGTSSGKVHQASSEMETIADHVSTSHGLLTKLNRREITDKLLILLGLAFFFGVVLYILRKRLLGWIW